MKVMCVHTLIAMHTKRIQAVQHHIKLLNDTRLKNEFIFLKNYFHFYEDRK